MASPDRQLRRRQLQHWLVGIDSYDAGSYGIGWSGIDSYDAGSYGIGWSGIVNKNSA